MARGMKTGGKNFEPGNPGRPPCPPDLKEARKLSKEYVERTLNEIGEFRISEIKKLMQDDKYPAKYKALASLWVNALTKGSIPHLQFVLDYTIGRLPVKTSVDFNHKTLMQILKDDPEE